MSLQLHKVFEVNSEWKNNLSTARNLEACNSGPGNYPELILERQKLILTCFYFRFAQIK